MISVHKEVHEGKPTFNKTYRYRYEDFMALSLSKEVDVYTRPTCLVDFDSKTKKSHLLCSEGMNSDRVGLAASSPMDNATAVIENFEQACQNVAEVQHDLLCRILRENAGCSYLQKYGSPKVPADFRAQIPVVSYDDVAGEIEKVANGDRGPVLCSYPITCFFASSGTSSGKHKIIPCTAENLSAALRALDIAIAHKRRCFPGLGSGRVLGLFYCIDQYQTKSGILVGAASTFSIKNEAFRRDRASKFTTPHEMLVVGSSWRELTYCHLLCALIQREEVEEIESTFAYTVCEALRAFRSDWIEICNDIKTGSLSSSKVTNSELREAFVRFSSSRALGGNEDLADIVSEICSRKSWSGILSSLFPRAKIVSTVVTGALAHFVPALRDYAGDGIRIAGKDYYSSEGLLGINTNPASLPEQTVYTISPQTLYYEFLPLGSSPDEVVVADEVVVGKQYELVVTNLAGLYRCRIGDVVKTTGKFHAAPQVAFSHRKNAVLSVQNEMVDEEELQNKVMEVSTLAGIKVANFTCYGDSSTSPAHYVIFWELESSDADEQVLERCCTSLDRSFNPGYTGKRLDEVIGPLELVIVKQGTFEKLMEEAVKTGTSPAQYKTPRCITSSGMLKVVNSEQLTSYKSEKMPRSVPENWEPSFPQGKAS